MLFSKRASSHGKSLVAAEGGREGTAERNRGKGSRSKTVKSHLPVKPKKNMKLLLALHLLLIHSVSPSGLRGTHAQRPKNEKTTLGGPRTREPIYLEKKGSLFVLGFSGNWGGA